jgi:hypothetical protein
VRNEAERQSDSAGQLLHPSWQSAQGSRSNFATTAARTARFMTLLAQGKLVDPKASEEMLVLLDVMNGGLGSDAKDTLEAVGRLPVPPPPNTSIAAKYGRGEGDNFRHECTIIKRTVAGKDLHYVAVGLGARDDDILGDLFVLLDEAIVTRNR